MVGHFYVRTLHSDEGRQAGTGKALSSAEQSSDRLVWDEEKPDMPEPLQETAGVQGQLCEVDLV